MRRTVQRAIEIKVGVLDDFILNLVFLPLKVDSNYTEKVREKTNKRAANFVNSLI